MVALQEVGKEEDENEKLTFGFPRVDESVNERILECMFCFSLSLGDPFALPQAGERGPLTAAASNAKTGPVCSVERLRMWALLSR